MQIKRNDVGYVVKDEHTLGYLFGSSNWMGVLFGSGLKGGHNELYGPVLIFPGHDRIRPATLRDFKEYRVVPPPDFDEERNAEKLSTHQALTPSGAGAIATNG